MESKKPVRRVKASGVGQFGTFNSVGYGVADREAARVVSTTGFFVGEFTGSILPVALEIFGVMALFAYLTNTPAGRWATIAMVPCILGSALTLPALGVINYALPDIARAYLAGQEDAFGIADAFFSFPSMECFSIVSLPDRSDPFRHRDLEVWGATQVGRGPLRRLRAAHFLPAADSYCKGRGRGAIGVGRRVDRLECPALTFRPGGDQSPTVRTVEETGRGRLGTPAFPFDRWLRRT